MLSNRIIVIGILTIVLALAIGLILFNNLQQNTTPSIPSVSGIYLNLYNGTQSHIYLVDSDARYGTYSTDVIDMASINNTLIVKKGDPCVIINGTVRNDDNDVYFLLIRAQLYNSSDEKVGQIIMPTYYYIPQKQYDTLFPSKNVSAFSVTIKYDKKDIKKYDILLSISKYPPV